MNPTDHPTFIDAITQLSEALGSRALTQAGMKTWVQTLKEFPLPDIVTQLDAWAKRSTRMAAPADIWKACNDMRTERIEQQAKVEHAHSRKDADAAFRRSDKFGQALRSLVKDLTQQAPADPKEWAHTLWHRYVADRPNPPRGHPVPKSQDRADLLDDPTEGTPITRHQIECACAALGRTVQQADEARDNYRRAQREAA